MGKKPRNSIGKAEEMSDKPIPGGYITKQLLDDITMTTSEVKKDIEATTRIAVEPAEFYRLFAKFSLQMQQIDKSVHDLNNIFENREER